MLNYCFLLFFHITACKREGRAIISQLELCNDPRVIIIAFPTSRWFIFGHVIGSLRKGQACGASSQNTRVQEVYGILVGAHCTTVRHAWKIPCNWLRAQMFIICLQLIIITFLEQENYLMIRFNSDLCLVQRLLKSNKILWKCEQFT